MQRRRSVLLAASACSVAVALAGCGADVVDGRGALASAGSAGTSGTSGTSVQQDASARFTEPADVASLLSDVREGVEALNTYDYRTLARDRTRALRYTTGKLTSDAARTFDSVIVKNAAALRAVQVARVVRAGVTTVDSDQATLLVFGQLDISTTATGSAGRTDPFSVRVRATRVAGTWKLAKVDVGGTSGTTVTGGSAGLRSAATAASSAATAITTFHRATYEADFARALSLLTGSLRLDVASKKASTLNTLRTGNIDLEASATSVAVEQAAGDRAVILVVIAGYRVVNGARTAAPTEQNLRVTVVRTAGRWLASQIEAVGVS